MAFSSRPSHNLWPWRLDDGHGSHHVFGNLPGSTVWECLGIVRVFCQRLASANEMCIHSFVASIARSSGILYPAKFYVYIIYANIDVYMHIYPPVIKPGTWKFSRFIGVSIGTSPIFRVCFPARHVWFPEGTSYTDSSPRKSSRRLWNVSAQSVPSCNQTWLAGSHGPLK